MDVADRSLWDAWRTRRDEGAFETLVRPHLGFAVDVARRHGCSRDDAEDAVQDALVRLAREPGERPVEVGVRAWLGRFVSLRSRMIRREGARRRRRERVPRAPQPEPAAGSEQARAVERALAELPEPQRVAVVLRYLHDVGYEEMARVLGASENACRIRAHRGVEALRRRLGAGAPALLAALPSAPPPADADAFVAAAVSKAGSASFALGALGGTVVMNKALAMSAAVLLAGTGAFLLTRREDGEDRARGTKAPAAEVASSDPAGLARTDVPAAVPAPAVAGAVAPAPRAPETDVRRELLSRIYGSGGKVGVRRTDAPPGSPAAVEWLDALPADLEGRVVVAVATGRSGATVWLADLGAFPDLTYLEVREPSDLDLSRIPTLPRLEEVRLDKAPVDADAIRDLARQPSLARLSLDDAAVGAEALRALSRLSALTSLSLDGSHVDDESLAGLSEVTRLRRLKLDETDVTDVGLERLAALTSLEDLDLTGTRVTGEGFRHLAALPYLKRLNLEKARVGDDGLLHAAALPRLEILDLEGTDVTDAGLAHLAASRTLVDLNLERTRVTDAAFEPLSRLTTLRRLNVGETRTTPEGIARFKSARPEVRVRD